MKANKFILAALAIAATASCQEDGLTGSEFTRETEPATIISGADTKTSLNGKEIHWTSDDEIAVFDNTNLKNRFNITDCEGSYATFSGEVTTGTTQIYAVYPYELAVSASGSNLVVNIPTDQTSKAGSFDEEHNISVAKGVKTPGHEAIGDVTFQNVCALLKFTIPSYISDAHTVTLSSNSVIAGNMSVDCSGDDPACKISSEGSKSISMTGDYSAGSTFIFVLAPGTLDGFTVKVQTGMANWSISRTTQVALEAGKYRNLGTLELEQVSASYASASHTYNGNKTLTGTNVTVNLNLPESTKQYITALNLVVKNEAGTEVRKVSKKAAETIEIGADDEWPYLPQGKYTVSGTYTLSDNTTKEIAEISFTSPEPDFTVTSGAYSSYTKYKNGEITAANNNCAADKIYAITTASVSIADKILNNSKYSNIVGEYTYTLDGAAAPSPEVSKQTWGPHTVTASYTFDYVTKEGSSDCHITGLPYSYNFVDGSLNAYKQDGWTTNGSLRVSNESAIGGKNTLVLHHYRNVLFSTENEKGYVVSPGFNLPEAIDIQPSVVRGSYCSSGDLTRNGYIGAVSNQTSSNTSSITYTVSGGMGSSFTGSGSWLSSFQISPSKPYVSIDCDTKKKGAGSYYWLCEVHLRYAQ